MTIESSLSMFYCFEKTILKIICLSKNRHFVRIRVTDIEKSPMIPVSGIEMRDL